MKKILLLIACALTASIHAMNEQITYDDIKSIIKNPPYGKFEPQINVNQLTPEQRTTLAELAEAQYNIRFEAFIEKTKTFGKDHETRPLTQQEMKSHEEDLLHDSWKHSVLWGIMTQFNPGYCYLRAFIGLTSISLPQPSKQELEDKIRSANLTSEQAGRIFALANKELKARREVSSEYLDNWFNFPNLKEGKKSEIATLPDGREPREVKIEILENIIEIVHPYR